MNELVELKQVRRYLKPYCMRHTFITNEIKKNTPIYIIAQQCGTSIKMITKTYLVSNDWWLDDDELNLEQYDSFIQEYK